jgi:HIP---CoA ligase
MSSTPELLTYSAVIDHAVKEFGSTQAIVDGETRIDYSELGARIDLSARALIASGIDHGDRVAVWAPNIWEWVVSALSVLRVGAVLVPVNTRFKGREAAYVLQRANVKALFTVVGFLGSDYVADLAAAEDKVDSLEHIIVLRGETPSGTVTFDDFLSRAGACSDAQFTTRLGQIAGTDLSLLMFTSGTTGLPKGVMLNQAAILHGFQHYANNISLSQGDRFLVIPPFFHAFGFNGAITVCIMRGATIIPHPVFDVDGALQQIQDERITVMPAPPAVFQSFLNHAELASYDLSSLRSCITGAATIPVDMVIGMRERLGFDVVVTAYGMTETHGIATICWPDDSPETIASTSGRALPGIELRVVDEAGRDVARGKPGELLIRGYCVMMGYLDQPEQTAETIDAEGWMKTGDIVVMDERGYIDITDRKKDMFINGGFNAYPAEIERTMLSHPEIGQVAVIGVPDARLGEVGAAFFVAAPDTAPDPSAVLAWCREEMANYKVPRFAWQLDALPLNPSGKVLKTELRERAAALLPA